MTLTEYLNVLRKRSQDAEKMGATAPVHKVLAQIADELESVHDMPDRPMTTAEAAAYMGYTKQYVAALCRNGSLPGAERPHGGEWRIPRDAVREYMNVDKTCINRARNLPSTPTLI